MKCEACAGTGRVTFLDGEGCACDACDATGDTRWEDILTRIERALEIEDGKPKEADARRDAPVQRNLL